MGTTRNPKTRHDGWTAERQLRFLQMLARTRSVTTAARAVAMSRESAYRLRGRRDGALFAAAWDRAMKGHKPVELPRPRRGEEISVSRTNRPKVTKLKKWKDPCFDTWRALLRDLREPAPCPSPRAAAPDN